MLPGEINLALQKYGKLRDGLASLCRVIGGKPYLENLTSNERQFPAQGLRGLSLLPKRFVGDSIQRAVERFLCPRFLYGTVSANSIGGSSQTPRETL